MAVLVLAAAASGIDPQRAMSQYVRDRWGPEQGFPRGPVYALAQTPDGYLWIGTDAGLVRFDGLSFTIVKDATGMLPTRRILGLATDNEGVLWVRTQELTVLRYRDGRLEAPSEPGPANSFVSAMSRTPSGDVVISAMEVGQFRLRRSGFELLFHSSDLPRSPVTAVAQIPNGEVWVGTRDAGLFRLNGGKTERIRPGLPDAKVDCLLPDGHGDLLVGTDNGITRWNGRELTAAGLPSTLNGVQALAMVRDRDGNLWVGTDSRGLLRLNSQGVASFSENTSGSSRAITALLEDREGSLWIGSADGIERLRDSAFVTYSQAEGLPTEGSNPVYVDLDGRLWFAPIAGGMWWMKDGQSGRITQDGLDKDVAYSLAGSAGNLWVGRQRGGLTHLQSTPGGFVAKTYTQHDGLAQNSVYSVYVTRDGTVWAGTLSAGVTRLAGGQLTTFTSASGLASNTVVSILEAADGTMWFATPTGVSSFANERWQTFTTANGLGSDNTNCLFEDSGGVLWVGTAAGLEFRSDGRFQVPPHLPPVLREAVLGLTEGRFGGLWIATATHVLRVRRDPLLHGSVSDRDLREFGPADGLRGTEGVKRHRSVIRDSSGRIWLSLNRGISVADPARLQIESPPALPQVQTVTADGGTLGLEGGLHIPGGSRRVTFAFAGMSLAVPERIRFRYRLDGYDHDWSAVVAMHEADYTNLSPGPYRFRVMASNPDGVWSPQEAALSFRVDPLVWQTWWFRLGAILVLAGAILFSYRLRMQRLTGRLALRFQERLAERTRIAQELHDTLLQGFLSASMQMHVVADSLPPESPAKPGLTRVHELMGKVIDEGRRAVQGLRASPGASLGLENALSRIRDEFVPPDSTPEPSEFRIIVEGEPRPLHPVLRDEVYGIGREAIVNAFRHAQASHIEVELRYATHDLTMLVSDDGRGIDPQILRSGNQHHRGLSGMRERADRIQSELHLFSNAAGTDIELWVPGHVAYQDQPPRRLAWLPRLRLRSNPRTSKNRSATNRRVR